MVSIVFGGGKVDITDRANRLLGQHSLKNITIDQPVYTIDCTNVVAFDMFKLLLKTAQILSVNDLLIAFSNLPNLGNMSRKYIARLYNTLHVVNDARHSPDLELQDFTTYTINNTSPATITIDYGSIYTFKEMQLYISATGSYSLTVQISNDNSTYTTINPVINDGTYAYFTNMTFRYLKITFSTTSTNYVYIQLRKILLTR